MSKVVGAIIVAGLIVWGWWAYQNATTPADTAIDTETPEETGDTEGDPADAPVEDEMLVIDQLDIIVSEIDVDDLGLEAPPTTLPPPEPEPSKYADMGLNLGLELFPHDNQRYGRVTSTCEPRPERVTRRNVDLQHVC